MKTTKIEKIVLFFTGVTAVSTIFFLFSLVSIMKDFNIEHPVLMSVIKK